MFCSGFRLSYLVPKIELSPSFLSFSKSLVCRTASAAKFSCGANVANQETNEKLKRTIQTSLTYDKWPQEGRTKISRAYQQLKFRRLIKSALRVGDPYPEQNPKLANLIEEAKKQDISIPLDDIIGRTLNSKLRSGIHEISAPSGVLLVLQYESVDISLTEHLIREVCEKYNYILVGNVAETRRLTFFNPKGILTASSSKHDVPLESEEASEIAIKEGAEFVYLRPDENEKITLEIYCNPSNLHQIKRQLENYFVIEEAFVGFVPKSLAKVSDSVKLKMVDAIVDACEISVIEMIYDNIK